MGEEDRVKRTGIQGSLWAHGWGALAVQAVRRLHSDNPGEANDHGKW